MNRNLVGSVPFDYQFLNLVVDSDSQCWKKLVCLTLFFVFDFILKKNILQFYTVLHQVVFRYSINAHTWTSLIIYHCPDLSSLCQVLHMWKAMFCFVLTCSESVTVHSDDTFLSLILNKSIFSTVICSKLYVLFCSIYLKFTVNNSQWKIV